MLYNNETLKSYCEFLKSYCEINLITLLENYDDIKINRECYIQGLCKNNFGKEFNKSFRQLVKTGSYCNVCTIENG